MRWGRAASCILSPSSSPAPAPLLRLPDIFCASLEEQSLWRSLLGVPDWWLVPRTGGCSC